MKPGRSTRVSCGRSGPQISMLNTSFVNARRVAPLLMSPRPMAFVALSMRSGSSSKFVIESLNFVSSSFSFAERALSSMIFVAIDDFYERRSTISVANRVQRFSFRGKGISVMASNTELFPEDWSPQTTSCGNGIMSSMLHCRNESTILRTFR
jgi:hypothetical protein